MSLTVKRRRARVEIILDQSIAQEIADLGVKLDQAAHAGARSEAGADPIARDYAQRIERLRDQAAQDTVSLELEALPYNAWKQCIDQNRSKSGRTGESDLLGVVQSAVRLMLRSVTRNGKPLDADAQEIADLIAELPDGQFTPVWNAILNLNASLVDPKGAIESASRILGSSRSSGSAGPSASATNGGAGGRHAAN